MSTVTPLCGCVIDNGDDGETFNMVNPCELHSDPHDAIAEARAQTVATAQAKLDGAAGLLVRTDDGSFHVADVDMIAGAVTAVHASSKPLSRDEYVAAIEPINAALKAQEVEAMGGIDMDELRRIAADLTPDQVERLRALFEKGA